MHQTITPSPAIFNTAQLKLQMRVDASYTTEDSNIDAYGLAAQRYVEQRCRLSMGAGTYAELTRDYLIPLRFGDFDTLSGVDIADKAGNWTAITEYRLDLAQGIPYVVIDDDVEVPYSFRASYTAEANSADLAMCKQAGLMLAAHWFNVRESVSVSASVATVPHAVDMLLDSITRARI